MNALQDGLKNGSTGGSSGWASDDSPLLLLSPDDRLTLRQSFEGVSDGRDVPGLCATSNLGRRDVPRRQ